MKRKVKKIIGTVLIFASIGSIFYWETVGREKYAYSDMIVLNTDIEEGVVITSDMITTIKSDNKGSINNLVTNENEIIDKVS